MTSQTGGQVRPDHKPPQAPRRTRNGIKALVGGMACAAVISGCSVPHIASMSSEKKLTPKPTATASTPTPKASATSNATPSAAAKLATTKTVVGGGDLSDGSVTHTLNAGSRKLVVNYWTDQDPKTWTATQSAVVQLSAHIANGDKDHAVYVSRFKATMDDGSSVTTLADDNGDFAITPPYSYSSGLVVRSANPNATGATVIVQYDLLIQTAPNAMQFFRQTVIDTLHLTFVPKGNN